MCASVVSQADRLAERFVAVVARKRPFVRVNPPMTVEGGRLGERFVTQVAMVGTLPGMYPGVYRKITLAREHLPTDFARVRRRRSGIDAVVALVTVQCDGMRELFRAEFTLKRLVVRVDALVNVHTDDGAERPQADIAPVTFIVAAGNMSAGRCTLTCCVVVNVVFMWLFRVAFLLHCFVAIVVQFF